MKPKWSVLQTNIQPIYAHSLEEFNEWVNQYKTEEKIILTKSKNISQKTLRHLPASLTWQRGNRMEFHYIDGKTQLRVIYALHYDVNSELDEKISYEALMYFQGLMEQIPTDDVEEEIEIFRCPENPTSDYYNYVDERNKNISIDHCYSLDRNNSFPASMMEVYPQTKPWVTKYYQERLEKKGTPEYDRFKLFGSIFVGWLNNPKYHRRKAWKKIIDNSNRKVHALRKQIEANGNEVLLVNTDAIKFIGSFPYEGTTELGGFKYEWEDTKMYIKSVKSYAYVDETGKWKIKQAGQTKLDILKPNRDEWTLEDFKRDKELKVLHIKINRANNTLYGVYE